MACRSADADAVGVIGEGGAKMSRQATRRRGDGGFSALETLIVLGIVGLIAAVGIPAYASQAQKSVLRQNAQSLALQVKSYLALDLSPAYVADGEQAGGGEGTVSTALSGALRSGTAGRFTNPFSGSRVIACESAPPASPSRARPAVWITDDAHYDYAAFRTSATTESQLAGTLVVVFVTEAGVNSVEVFYVDAHGGRSPAAAALAL
jgi:type II secretory pathway pseudopilin PulG